FKCDWSSDVCSSDLEEGGAAEGLARLHPVDVAPQGVDLAVVGDVAVRMGERPGGKGVGGEALVHEGERGLHEGIRDVGEHRLDLVRREHALVDERVGGEAREGEECGGGGGWGGARV